MSDLSCMSFNILAYDTHNCGYEPAADRFPYVVKTIDKYAPDLIGVQEASALGSSKAADFDWPGEMVKAMAQRGYAASVIQEQEGFERDMQNIACGLIIFYKKDRFTLTESGAQVYPHDPVRYFQWAKFTDNKFDRNIVFTNTHFSIHQKVADKFNWEAGLAACAVEAVKLCNFWYKNCDENTALFATGDYNSDPTTLAQKLLSSYRFKPSRVVAKIFDESNSVNFAHGSHTIDFCYVNPDATTVDEYLVAKDHFESDADWKLAGYASDHRAVMTYVSYNEIKHGEPEQ